MVLRLGSAASPKFSIKINGKELIAYAYSVESLKEHIEDKKGIPVQEQNIFYAGQPLQDARQFNFQRNTDNHMSLTW